MRDCYAAGEFPPPDRWRIRAPVDVLSLGLGLMSVYGSGGVGNSGRTSWDKGGRKPAPALLPDVPVSLARGVGSSLTAIDKGMPIPLPLMPRARWRACRRSQPEGSSPSLGLLLAGVGRKVVTVSVRFTWCPPARRDSGEHPPRVSSRACGVGSSLTDSHGFRLVWAAVAAAFFRDRLRGEDGPGWVGEQKHPLASVGCADVGRSNACPLRVIPDFGQVAENDVEAALAPAEGGDVLHDEERRS